MTDSFNLKFLLLLLLFETEALSSSSIFVWEAMFLVWWGEWSTGTIIFYLLFYVLAIECYFYIYYG